MTTKICSEADFPNLRNFSPSELTRYTVYRCVYTVPCCCYLNEGHNVHDECRGWVHDELVDTGDGVRADVGVLVVEELDEFGDEHVKRPVEGIGVKLLRAVLTDLVQRTEGSLEEGGEGRGRGEEGEEGEGRGGGGGEGRGRGGEGRGRRGGEVEEGGGGGGEEGRGEGEGKE